MDAKELYRITGYHNYPINTFNRFLWIKENEPQALDEADYWLHVQDYIVYKLTGEFSTECTIASTEMALDLSKRTWSDSLFQQFGISKDFLSPLHESGSPIGPVTTEASQQSGIPAGSMVVTGGHDTEMAVIGAGINSPETFLDINGTWEILMAITNRCEPSDEDFSCGLDWECHAIPGWWNCQALMIAGGVIEWIRNQFYRNESGAYATMIGEAQRSPIGSNNVTIIPALVRGMGPSQAYDPSGAILGITTQTTREDIARATFECLTYQFYQQIEAIERSFGVSAKSVRVTGGGQKNPFWMQMKADISGRALDVLQDVESSMLGAAILAGIGSSVYTGLDDALQTVYIPTETVEPDMKNHLQYKEHYQSVVSKLPKQMQTAFQTIHSIS
jgi:L-fuculokinase